MNNETPLIFFALMKYIFLSNSPRFKFRKFRKDVCVLLCKFCGLKLVNFSEILSQLHPLH